MKRIISFFIICCMLVLCSVSVANAKSIDITDTSAEICDALSKENNVFVQTGSATLPTSYSSRELGYTTSIKTQQGDTCWAYSALDTFETFLNMKGENFNSLSTTNLNMWATTRDNGTGWQRDFNSSGLDEMSIGYLTSWNGAKELSDCPETEDFIKAKLDDSNSKPVVSATAVMRITSTRSDRENNSEEFRTAIKSAIYKYGAVAGAFHSDSSYYSYTNSSYYYDQYIQKTSNLVGHSVSIIGWDDNFSKDKFSSKAKPSTNGAWYCKNNWGETSSNDNGYFWISYEDKNLFDQRLSDAIVFLDYEKHNNKQIYQVEEYGATSEFGLRLTYNNEPIDPTFINIFDFKDNDSHITNVIFESREIGAKYTAYYIPVIQNNGTQVPDSNKDNWIEIGDGEITYSGYHNLKLNNFEIPNPNSKGAIGIQIIKPYTDTDKFAHIGMCKWKATSSTTQENQFVFIPDTQKNASFFIGRSNQAPVELTSYFENNEYLKLPNGDTDNISGNFVIKTITTRLIHGDANNSGTVEIEDSTRIQMHLTKFTTLSDLQQKCADCDGDSKISIQDATTLQEHIANIKTIGIINTIVHNI